MPGLQITKISYLYFRTDYRELQINTSNIRKNALHELTLIKLINDHSK